MHVTTRTGLRRFGGAALAVATAATLAGLAAPAYADETAPAPIAAEATAPPAGSPAPPVESPAPSATPAPAATPVPSFPVSNQEPAAPRAAAAAATGEDLAVSLRGTTVSTGSALKFLQVIATNKGPKTAKRVVLDIAIAPTAPNTIELDATAADLDCVETGADSMRCVLGDIPAGLKVTVGVPYRAAAGAAANPAAANVSATVSSSSPDADATNDTVNGTIAIVPPASDVLVVADDIADAVPGEITEAGVLVLNFGGRPTGPAELTVAMPAQTTIVRNLPGCVTAADRRSLTCRYDSLTSLEGDPDQAGDFLVLPVKVDATLVGPRTLTGGTATVVDDPSGPQTFATGPVRTAALRNPVGAARLAALTDDADRTDNNDTFVATVAAVANLALTTGPVRIDGDRATVPYTVRSAGPAVATGVYVKTTAPTGTTFDGVPANCTRSGRTLRCDVAGSLAVGASVAGAVTLRITGTTVGRDGSIAAGFDGYDPTAVDNTVALRIASPGSLNQGGLAVTGTKLALTAGTGAAMLLLGGALVLLARRRRAVAVQRD
ncbi:MAG: hypothetical protein QOC93_941 [Actinomycetota bacterium]|jgi:hypothetical protein|nr:hypothetical protein [Actinomycetota bacterium]